MSQSAQAASGVPAQGTVGTVAHGTSELAEQRAAEAAAHGTSEVPVQGTAEAAAHETFEVPVQGTAEAVAHGTSVAIEQRTADGAARAASEVAAQGSADAVAHGISEVIEQGAADAAAHPTAEAPAQGTADAAAHRTSEAPAQGMANRTSKAPAQGTADTAPPGPSDAAALGTATAAGVDLAWEEKLHRLAGTGPWEWDVRSGTVYWYAQGLAVLGSAVAPGPLPADRPPYVVHQDDAADHDAFLKALIRDGRPGHVEVRVLQPARTVRHIRFGGEPACDAAGEVVRVYGSVQDVTDRRRTQTALEIAQVQLAARRSRADSERQLASLLQQVIMPTGQAPDALPGIELATRYRPASAAAGVGGDWYGVTRLGDDRLLLHVGDVAGHGFPAATAMARLYHALHGLSVTGGGSAQLLHWLNKLTFELPEFTIASACCAVYDPAKRVLALASAGHPDPVLVRDGRATPLAKPLGGMLGVDPEGAFEETEHIIEPGDVLLLYTDGLIERRRRAPEENIASLLEHAARPPEDLGAYADRILHRVRSDTDDDACLVAVRFS